MPVLPLHFLEHLGEFSIRVLVVVLVHFQNLLNSVLVIRESGGPQIYKIHRKHYSELSPIVVRGTVPYFGHIPLCLKP